MMPGFSKAKVRSRIILAPQHAKKLMNALNQNINNFEKQNGNIRILILRIPLDFGGPTAQEETIIKIIFSSNRRCKLFQHTCFHGRVK